MPSEKAIFVGNSSCMKLFNIFSSCRRLSAVILTVFAAICASTAGATMPKYAVAPVGTFPEVHPGSSVRLIVESDALGDEMTVDVWLPPAYDASSPGGFPVIYAHDGQNLFDPSLSFSTVAWELDNTAAALAGRGEIAAPVIVGIHNRGAKGLRPNDYFPEKAVTFLDDPDKNKSLIWATCASGFYGDEHAAFVATELKPLVDSLFNTNPDPDHTFALGSSMGALASLYLLCEYPDIFGGAACMSTHWTGSFKMNQDYTLQPDEACARAILDYLDARLPGSAGRKLYLDQGSTGWDAGYLTYERIARETAQAHGYTPGAATLMTYDAAGAGHNEWFWQQRADRPLRFLLGSLTGGISGTEIDSQSQTGPLYDLHGRVAPLRPLPGIYVQGKKKILVRRR